MKAVFFLLSWQVISHQLKKLKVETHTKKEIDYIIESPRHQEIVLVTELGVVHAWYGCQNFTLLYLHRVPRLYPLIVDDLSRT